MSPGPANARRLSGAGQAVVSVLGGLVALLLFVMMTLTFVDVIGRYFFNRPLQASYEITEVLLATAIFAALPLATLRREHVTVSLFDRLFQGSARRVQQFAVGLISFVVLSGMSWRLAGQARTLAEYGDRSLFMQIPYAGVVWFMAAMAAISSVIVLGLTLSAIRRP